MGKSQELMVEIIKRGRGVVADLVAVLSINVSLKVREKQY